jgi:hypothetical protein
MTVQNDSTALAYDLRDRDEVLQIGLGKVRHLLPDATARTTGVTAAGADASARPTSTRCTRRCGHHTPMPRTLSVATIFSIAAQVCVYSIRIVHIGFGEPSSSRSGWGVPSGDSRT